MKETRDLLREDMQKREKLPEVASLRVYSLSSPICSPQISFQIILIKQSRERSEDRIEKGKSKKD